MWEVQAVLELGQDMFRGQRCSRWIWGCQGPISKERPPHFCLLALGGVGGYSHWVTALC